MTRSQTHLSRHPSSLSVNYALKAQFYGATHCDIYLNVMNIYCILLLRTSYHFYSACLNASLELLYDRLEASLVTSLLHSRK